MRLLFVIFLFASALTWGAIDKNKVFVVVNSANEKSVKLAKDYCKFRDIPEANIVLLNIPQNNGVVSRKFFSDNIEKPLFAELLRKGGVSAMDLKVLDSMGRPELLLNAINLDFLVLCKGIPWGVSDLPQEKWRTVSVSNASASVDSEISARFLSSKRYDGFLKNPAFKKIDSLWRSFGLIRVARLDGASFDDVYKMIENIAFVENNGLRGRAYLDKSKRAKLGDDWLDVASDILQKQGFDVSVDERTSVMGWGQRMDYPAFYFGWYSTVPCGYFTMPNFSAKGMIGWHIYSFSALNMNLKNSWTSTLISKGATSTDGNVFEPYLGLTRNIAVFVKLVFEHKLLPAEASFASLQVLSWQNIYIGDPLYNPLKKSLDEQLKNLSNDDFSQYSVIRKANLIEREFGSDKARVYLASFVGKIPDNAIKWKIYELSKNNAEKIVYAQSVAEDISVNYLGLAFEACTFLEKNGKWDIVFDTYEKIFHKYISNEKLLRFVALKAQVASRHCSRELSPLIKIVLEKIEEEKLKAQQERLKKQQTKK